MSNVIENLKENYNAFITLPDEWGFFRGMAEYVKFILENPDTTKIIENFNRERIKLEDEILKCEDEGIKIIEKGEKSLISNVEKKSSEIHKKNRKKSLSAPDPNGLKHIKEFKMAQSNQWLASGKSKLDYLTGCFLKIVKIIYKDGYKKEAEEFIEKEKNFPDEIILKEEFLEKLRLYFKLNLEQEDKRRTEIWGLWEKLYLIYIAELSAPEYEEEMEKFEKDGQRNANLIPKLIILHEKIDAINFNKINSFNSYEKQRYASCASIIHSNLTKELSAGKIIEEKRNNDARKNFPKSIHLVSQSIVANDVIFFVIDEQWQMPIRFLAKNKNGNETAIKKLHNIAYVANAPGKKVLYDKQLADNINNGLFKNPKIANYMETNKLDKPTLVRKSKDGILVLESGTIIKDILIQKVPTQHQSLYTDKTK